MHGISRVYVYIDDVVISVNSHEENLLKLKDVFSKFREHNLKIKPSKCNIGTGKITYLRYEISATKGITPGVAKTGPVLLPFETSELLFVSLVFSVAPSKTSV